VKRTLLKDIANAFISLPKGLAVTAKNWLWTRPSVTEQYPEERPKLPERYRGVPSLPVAPKTGLSRCIACGACARICPEHIITVTADKGETPKDRKPAQFDIDISRCMWCGLCTEVCPTRALIPARDFELACYSREEMVYHLDDLMRLGGKFSEEPDVESTSTTNEETQS